MCAGVVGEANSPPSDLSHPYALAMCSGVKPELKLPGPLVVLRFKSPPRATTSCAPREKARLVAINSGASMCWCTTLII